MKHTIHLHDEISNATFQRVLSEIKSAGRNKIVLSINSPGGSVTAGSAIMASLNSHKPGVECEILGLAASMASVIACVGNPVSMAQNAVFMLHMPSMSTTGTADQHRKDADILDVFAKTLIATYAAKSKKTTAEIKVLLDAETWMSAEEALAAGFIDKITGATSATASAWSAKYPHLAASRPAVPQTLVATFLAISDPDARATFYRKNRIAIIRENARSATPALPPSPQTLSDKFAAITDPGERSTFYRKNRSLLIHQAANAARNAI